MRYLFILLLVFSCATPQKVRFYDSLNITEKNPDAASTIAHSELKKLVIKYDLSSFFYTKDIVIDSNGEQQSHPVLTLNAKYVTQPQLFLSQLLHEQLHWWMDQNQAKVAVAIPDLKKAFRHSPMIKGAKDPDATYRHLVICWMEYMAVSKYMGEEVAKKNLNYFINVERKYPWIYRQVLSHSKEIWEIVGKHDFIPTHLFQQISIIR